MRCFVGIDIGQDELRMVALRQDSSRSLELFIQHRMLLSDIPLSQEVSSSYHAVKWLLNKYELPSNTSICLTFPSSFFYSKRVQFPTEDSSKIRSMLQYELENFIPGQISNFIWDSTTVSHRSLSGQTDVLFCALDKEKVQLFFQEQEEEVQHLLVSAIEAVPFSIVRLVTYLGIKEDGFYLHIDEDMTYVMMMADGGFWVHTIPIGYRTFVNQLSEKLSCDVAVVQQTLSKNLLDSMENAFIDAYRYEVQSFWNEVHEMIQFYRQNPLAAQIHHVVVCGYLSPQASFRELLSSCASLLIEPLDLSSKFKNDKISLGELSVFSVALGNALREAQTFFPFETITLLPEELIKIKQNRSVFYFQILMIIVLILMIVCSFYFFKRENDLLNQKQKFVHSQTQLIMNLKKQFKHFQTEMNHLHQSRSFIRDSLALRFQPIDVFFDIYESWSSSIELSFLGVNIFSPSLAPFQLNEDLLQALQPYLSTFSSLCVGSIEDSYGELEAFRLFLSQQDQIESVTVLVAEKELVNHAHRIYFILGLRLRSLESDLYFLPDSKKEVLL